MPLNIKDLISVASEENQLLFADAQEVVKNYLKSLKSVKIFVADSRNFGHQSSSIVILLNLIRLGCRANFTVVYENQNALKKIRILLPINISNVQPITLPTPTGETVNVNFLLMGADQPKCDLALTGGYDEKVDTLISLNADFIIELQPFKWKKKNSENAIWINKNKTVISLDDQIDGFNQLAFFIDTPVKDETLWTKFSTIDSSWSNTMNLTAKVLNLYEGGEDFFLLPTYGINTGSIDPIMSLFNLCCGVSYLQDQQVIAARKKTVIVSFSPYNQTGQDNDINLETLKKLITNSNYTGKGFLYQPNDNCKLYLTSSNLKDRVKYYYGLNPTELEVVIKALKSNEILVVQIGPVPAPMFNYCYFKANLPFLFEGQNTATLALNLGRAYFHIAAPGAYDDLFPVLPPDSKVSNSNGKVATAICSKISEFPGNWKSPTNKLKKSDLNTQNKPGVVQGLSSAYILGKYIAEMVNNDPKSNMIKYFKKFGNYYHDEKNDKLIDSLIYLTSNIIYV